MLVIQHGILCVGDSTRYTYYHSEMEFVGVCSLVTGSASYVGLCAHMFYMDTRTPHNAQDRPHSGE